MAGLQVNRPLLDSKAAHTVIAVREAFENVETISAFLATVPSDAAGGDPLTQPLAYDDAGNATGYGYTPDEAYLIRYVFEGLKGLNIQPVLDAGRKLTGLE